MDLEAVIFDMDGLLIDSEPLWQEAELDVFNALGLNLGKDDLKVHMGMRLDKVVATRYQIKPWQGPDLSEVESKIVERVAELIDQRGEALPGAEQALSFVRSRNLKCGLASSSPMSLIERAISKLGFADYFQEIHSAQFESEGKPHPAVYLTICSKLAVDPENTLALEDSPSGIKAAKRAGMQCFCVPDQLEAGHHDLQEADLVMKSLADLESVIAEQFS